RVMTCSKSLVPGASATSTVSSTAVEQEAAGAGSAVSKRLKRSSGSSAAPVCEEDGAADGEPVDEEPADGAGEVPPCAVPLPRYPGPTCGSCFLENAVAAALARLSAASFMAWPAWPLTHSNSTLRPASARSMSFSSSTFMTGLPSFFRQPLRFQPGIHLVTELMTYWLSQRMCRCWSASTAVASRRSRTALSSPMLLVPWGQPPARQVSSSMYQAQPAGPGLPRAEPSAAAVIVIRQSFHRPRTVPDRDRRRPLSWPAARSAPAGDGHAGARRRGAHGEHRLRQLLGVDHAAHGPCEVEPSGGDVREQLRVLGDGQAVAAEDLELLGDDAADGQGRVRVLPQQQPHLDVTAAGAQRLDRGAGCRRGAERVEADVDSAAGLVANARGDVRGRRKGPRAEGFGGGERGRGDVDGEHLGASGEGDHHAGEAQPAASEHRDRLAGPDRGLGADRVMGGAHAAAEPGGEGHVDLVREGDEV